MNEQPNLIAYNLLRTVMWQAGKQAEVCPMRISLQGTRHTTKCGVMTS